MSKALVDQVAKTIAPSTYPNFKRDVTSMIDEMDLVFANSPVETQAKGFAEILVKYGCA